MRKRKRVQSGSGVQMFPFLDALICTMGALLVLLHAFARHGQVEAVKKAESQVTSTGDVQADREEIEWRINQLKDVRAKAEADLAEERQRLSHVEDHERRLREQFEKLRIAAKELERLGKQTGEQDQKSLAELAQATSKLSEAKAAVSDSKRLAEQKAATYSVVPYEGPNSTRRRPIYIECRADCVVLQPEGVELPPDCFIGFMGPGNPLASALRGVTEYYARQSTDGKPPSEPYPLLLVRPEGIGAYYAARGALDSWGTEFGYELIGEDWKLAFPAADPRLAEIAKQVVADARVRQRDYVVSMAQMSKNNRPRATYHASSRGGFSAERGGGGGGRGAGTDGRGPGGWDSLGSNWANGEGAGAGSTAPGAGGTGTGGTTLGGGGGGGDRLFGSSGGGGLDGKVGAGPGGQFANGGTGSSPNGADGRGGTLAGTGGGPELGGGLGGSPGGGGSSNPGGASAAGMGPYGSGPYGSNASASGADGSGTDGSGRYTTGPTGSPSDQIAGNSRYGSTGGAGGGQGDGASGGTGNAPSSGSQRGPDGQPNGSGQQNGSGNQSAGSTTKTYGSQGGRDTQGMVGQTGSGAAGSGGSSGSGSPGGGSSGGSSSPISAGSPAPNFDSSPVSKTQSMAKSRGRDWGLPDASPAAAAATRPILVECHNDRLVIIPESRNQLPKEVRLGAQAQESMDEFVSGVWQHMKGWGMAGKNLYWRPTLVMDVKPGAADRYAEVKSLLADSGLDVHERRAQVATPPATQKPTRR
jgi:hypothetical protein